MCNIIINTFYINTFTFINTFYINTSVKSVDNDVTNRKISTIIKILAIFIFSSKSKLLHYISFAYIKNSVSIFTLVTQSDCKR